ncbi:hypothetical protein K2173_004558 [Erythroxylum novogranatense]|uniref:AMP-activated protein kinase glycogen-binding domain-containing protein n=1 Tax=Erythroxylum novogranatense TaxID=1862640 RepID=A0AAV8T693_9ROSI|nr:hypothetical protein K2173_004558 [Erythroxylum novogranatense]
MDLTTDGCSLGRQVRCFPWKLERLDYENILKSPCNVISCKTRMRYPRMGHSYLGYTAIGCMSDVYWRSYSIPSSMEESSSLQSEESTGGNEHALNDSPEDLLAQKLNSDELKSLLADSERRRLITKLSEANQQNRFLKRQLHVKDDTLMDFKRELAMMELELQALVTMSEEVAQSSIPKESRKINGKYIQYHLHSRLKAIHGKMKEQIKDVDLAQSKEISLFWCGMAESVQVMGSFDGWSQGEQLSPEYDGSFTRFTTSLMLRPGRYEIKFLVDGEWLLSPEYPTIGEGLTKNNLLIVE